MSMSSSPPNLKREYCGFEVASEQSESGWPSSDEEYPAHRRKRRRSIFGRLVCALVGMSARQRRGGFTYDYHAAPTEEASDGGLTKNEGSRTVQRPKWSQVSRLLKRAVFWLPILVLTFFGILHIILVLVGQGSLSWSVDMHEEYLPNWGQSGRIGHGLARYPTDATRDVVPIPCHSHNDYWRRVPLFDAIHAGCTSVEADVWFFEGEEELFVGHTTASLTRNRTFRNLYVDPLVDLLDSMNRKTSFSNSTGNGVFDEVPGQSLVLLVDFKTDGRELWPHVRKQLESLRQKDYLSHWNGETFISKAVTVVGTGNTPFDLVVEDKTYRDVFFDAPLDELWERPRSPGNGNDQSQIESTSNDPTQHGEKVAKGQGKVGTGIVTSTNDFNTSTSYYASTSFAKTIGYPWFGRLSDKQMELIRGQIKGAKMRGLKARYWETPWWPTSLRNRIWDVLITEGADILDVDDLEGAAKTDWKKPRRHDWFDA